MAAPPDIPSIPKLSAIVAAVGGEAANEFGTLLALARIGAAVQAAMGGMQGDLHWDMTPLAPAPVVHRARGRPRTTAKPDPRERLTIQLDLLRAEAKGEAELEEAYTSMAARIGREGGKSSRRVAGALLARAHGRHRANFISRLKATGLLTDRLCSELARLYSKIEGKRVTLANLQREAKAAKP